MSSTKTFKSFTKRLGIKITIPLLILMLFMPTSITTFNAFGQTTTTTTTVTGAPPLASTQTQDCFAPLTTILDATYAGPVVVDSYWVDQGTSTSTDITSNPVKKEIGPGEGPSVFAVVFTNRNSNYPITSVTAFLNLPAGFVGTGESKNPQLLQNYDQVSRVVNQAGTAQGPQYALANYYGQVPAGAAFTMYFNINVLPSAKVSTFATTVVTNYVKVGEVGTQCSSALLDVPFVLPGKVILDASVVTPDLIPQSKNTVSIAIENKGSADATGVVATIAALGNSKGATGSSSNGGQLVLSSTSTVLVNLGPSSFNIGTIHPGQKVIVSTVLFPGAAASGSTQNVELSINYQNAWGKLSNADINTGIDIPPSPPQSLSLSYIGNSTTPLVTAGELDDLDFAVQNNSTYPMSNVVVSLVPQSTSVSIVGTSTWTIQDLEPGNRQVLNTKVFAATSLINSPTSFTLTANYVSKGAAQANSLTLGAFVIGSIKLQVYDLTATSGASPGLTGNLLNQGSTTGLFTTIQLAPSQLLQAMRTAMRANSTNSTGTHSAFTQAGSSGGAAGQGFSGQAGAGGQGFSGQAGAGGQGFSGQAGAGGQGSSGRGAGGQGYTGQGGASGGIGARGSSSSAQFIGDLSPDSPIPFSVPVRGINSLPAGAYQVAFKVVYADDLKTFHTVILNGTVAISGKSPSSNVARQTSIFDKIPFLPMPQITVPAIGIAAVAAAIAVSIIKRKRRKDKKLKLVAKGGDDIVSIFDSDKSKKNES